MKNRMKKTARLTPFALIFVIVSVLFVCLSLWFRYQGLKFISWDMRCCGFVWYGDILQHGLWNLLKTNISNYTPPYLYLLGLASLTASFLDRIIAIKSISLAFDIYCAILIFKIVRLKYKNFQIPLLAASIAFLLPTVILNSAYWGQVDSLYTAFLLTSLYFLLIDRPGWGVFFFGVAFSIKLQSFFFAPFLIALAFRKKIPWKNFLLVPLVYFLFILPAALEGVPLLGLLTIYLNQADSTNQWSRNAGNPYVFVPVSGQIHFFSRVINFPPYLFYLFLLAAAILTGIWIFFTVKRRTLEEPSQLVLAALASIALLPYILPRMHDRYFYSSDVLSLVVAFHNPRLWFLPVLFQIGSTLVYVNYLYGANYRNLTLAVFANTLALAMIVWYQFKKRKTTQAAA